MKSGFKSFFVVSFIALSAANPALAEEKHGVAIPIPEALLGKEQEKNFSKTIFAAGASVDGQAKSAEKAAAVHGQVGGTYFKRDYSDLSDTSFKLGLDSGGAGSAGVYGALEHSYGGASIHDRCSFLPAFRTAGEFRLPFNDAGKGMSGSAGVGFETGVVCTTGNIAFLAAGNIMMGATGKEGVDLKSGVEGGTSARTKLIYSNSIALGAEAGASVIGKPGEPGDPEATEKNTGNVRKLFVKGNVDVFLPKGAYAGAWVSHKDYKVVYQPDSGETLPESEKKDTAAGVHVGMAF